MEKSRSECAQFTRVIKQPILLLGEGKEELRIFKEFAKYWGLEVIQVEQYEGTTKLKSYLKTLTQRPGYHGLTAVAVTCDADDNVQDTFKKVCDALKHAGLPQPAGPGEFTEGPPRVGVYILPDCKSTRMLEDLCLRAIENDPAMPCVDEYFHCLKGKVDDHSKESRSKARMRAWLASRPDPEKRMGEAVQAGYIDLGNPAFDQFKKFLLTLSRQHTAE